MSPPAPQTFEDWKLVLLAPWGNATLVLLAAVALVAVVLSAWGCRRERRAVALLLTSLRLLGVAAALLLVLQPALQRRSVTRVPNHLALLLDTSRSMTIRARAGGPTRIERALALLSRSRGQLDRWRRQRIVERFAFDTMLRPATTFPSAAAGAATDIHAALQALRGRYRRDELAGVVLISDGNDNGRLGSGSLSAADRRFVKRLRVPVHTVLVGADDVRDLSIAAVHADDFAFVRNAVKVEVDLLANGITRERRIHVKLHRGDAALAEQELELRRGSSRHRLSFEFVPQRVGDHIFRVSAPALAGEAITANNQRSFLVKVIRDRIRVLQICGRPSWDERFLRRLLKRDPNVDLISFFILRTPASLALVPPRELSLIPFPTTELFERRLGSFDLIVLQNFNYGPYRIRRYLPHIRRYVLQGGALAMIGGDLSFTSGGYADTPVAEVLPVRLLPPRAGQLISVGEFRARPTARGADHPIMQIGRDRAETRQLFARLPKLAGINRVAGLAAGATLLAAHPRLRGEGGKPLPLLATREVGRGRTLALTSDSLWRWAFLAVGEGGTRAAYDRFWRNAIRWLIKDPELQYLRIIAERDRLRLGQQTGLVFRAYEPDYQPSPRRPVTYAIEEIGGAQLSRGTVTTDGDGEARVVFEPPRAGSYRVTAEAVLGGRRTEARRLLVAEPGGPELRDPRALPRLLEQLAEASGGRYLGRADELPDLELVPPQVLRVNWRRDHELWNRWWSLALVVLLLGLEWLLRRRFGHL